MKQISTKLKNAVFKHKLRNLIILAVLIAGGYYGYLKFKPADMSVKYVTEDAAKTTLTVSVSSSGQVSDLNSIELKPAAGSNNVSVTQTKVKAGDKVRADDVIAILDQKDAVSSLRQAQAAVNSARANYDKVMAGTSELELSISKRSITTAEQNYQNTLTTVDLTKKTIADNLSKAEKDLAELKAANPAHAKRDAVLTTIQEKLNSAKTSLDTENKTLTDDDLSGLLSAMNRTYLNNAQSSYDQAKTYLNTANASYDMALLNKTDSNLQKAVEDAIKALKMASDSNSSLYDALKNTPSSSTLSQTTIDGYKSTANTAATAMIAAANSIQSAYDTLKNAIEDAQEALDDAKLSSESQLNSAENSITSSKNSIQTAKDNLAKLEEPADAQEIASAKNSITNALVQLEQAQKIYDDTIITSPFDGVVAEFNVQKGDQVSASTIIGTIITENKIAEVSFNEVDASKIKTGNKVIITFDAIDGLEMTGKVAEIGSIGAVSSGVVTYPVKISFDTQDDRIKTNMSINIEVITDSKTDVIAVSSSAIKSDDAGNSYVQVMQDSGLPKNVIVLTGISNDTMTEITSGLNEGDKVVTQTVTGSSSGSSSSNSSSNSKNTKNSSMGGMGMIMGGGGPRD